MINNIQTQETLASSTLPSPCISDRPLRSGPDPGCSPRFSGGRCGTPWLSAAPANPSRSQAGTRPTRARAGRDSPITGLVPMLDCFNPRARAGRNLRIKGRTNGTDGFNPRARNSPAGSTTADLCLPRYMLDSDYAFAVLLWDIFFACQPNDRLHPVSRALNGPASSSILSTLT